MARVIKVIGGFIHERRLLIFTFARCFSENISCHYKFIVSVRLSLIVVIT